MNRRPWWLWAVIAGGYAFLYLPILSVIVYSFSASRLVPAMDRMVASEALQA